MNPRPGMVVVLAIAVTVPAFLAYWHGQSAGFLPTFRDSAEMAAFFDRSASVGGGDVAVGLGRLEGAAFGADVPFSRTNVQVEGVDELDTVKTDGSYLYLASWDNVTIVRAAPPESMVIVARISAQAFADADGTEQAAFQGLFLEGDRLIAVASVVTWGDPAVRPIGDIWIWPAASRTLVAVYDLSDIGQPTLIASYGVTGSMLTGRIVDGRAYVVVQDWVRKVNETYESPLVCVNGECTPMDPQSLHYDPESEDASAFTHVLAVDAREGGSNVLTIVTGYASTVYVSRDALYLTFLKWEGGWLGAPEGEPEFRTTIYKALVDGLDLQVGARGDVRGMLLNQFSMDERGGHLRVATTTSWREPSNDVYVLDGDLRIVGSLSGLAPTERIFAARFLRDTLYLVTFLQVDPLFVIDLSNPASPEVLGELKIPGFSTYLHPFTDGHVVGIGQENGSLKVSLFDVSDPTQPTEKGALVLEGNAWSQALYDHKAVLADPSRSLLVLPVNRWIWVERDGTVESDSGAYVFHVSAEASVELRGVVLHEGVYRSLYIGDVLYTISDTTVKASALADLSLLGSLVFRAS